MPPSAAFTAKIPQARILVTGCYAQRAPEEVAALPGVSLVVGNSHKHQLADYAAPQTSRDWISFRWRISAMATRS